jgi:hypothetical protein
LTCCAGWRPATSGQQSRASMTCILLPPASALAVQLPGTMT